MFLLAVCAGQAAAQDFWMQKSYRRWTKDEIVRIISDSPWAQVREIEVDATSGAWRPMVTVRLRSAVPIRQALVRLKQIESGYDKMDAKDRTAFDERMRGTLECPACNDNYVITISPPISNRRVESGVYGLKAATFQMLTGKVYLITEKGEKRELAHFVAPKNDTDEAIFYFPRRDSSGKALLTKDVAKFTFVFDASNVPIVGGIVTTERRIITDGSTPVIDTDSVNVNRTGRTIPRMVEFDVAEILIDGVPEF
jgi:hypothetical protein